MLTFDQFSQTCPDREKHHLHTLCKRGAIPGKCEPCGSWHAYVIITTILEHRKDRKNFAVLPPNAD